MELLCDHILELLKRLWSSLFSQIHKCGKESSSSFLSKLHGDGMHELALKVHTCHDSTVEIGVTHLTPRKQLFAMQALESRSDCVDSDLLPSLKERVERSSD
jgi:hypothetical protein